MIIKKTLDFLINTNIFVALCALSLSLSSEILLGFSDNQINQFVFFSTLFSYNFQKIIKKRANHQNQIWIERNRILVYIIMIISLIFGSMIFLDLQKNTKIWIIILSILSILYPFGLRKIPICKIFVISFSWTIGTLFLTICENNYVLDQDVCINLATRFLFVFSITIPFDIRDLKHDNRRLKTIPILLGVKKSKYLAMFSLFLFAFINILLFSENSPIILTVLLTYIISSILILKSHEKKNEFFFSFYIESLSITFYLFLTFSSLMF